MSMQSFIYQGLPGRVVFGTGSLERLNGEIEHLGAHKVLVLSTPGQRHSALAIAERIGDRAAGIYDQALMHVPLATAEAARAEAERLGADCCIAIGGGSTIGLGKAIALTSSLPIVAIPTTYAGSEMTPIYGLTRDGIKTTGRDLRVLPKTVIYDPTLTTGLPASVSGPSGMNAIAHCVEALYAQDANPIVSLMAEEGIRALAESLPVVVAQPENLEGRSKALYGAWLAGSALGSVGIALHHKLCHTLGGSFNLPHAEVHTVIIPHAAYYNADAAAGAMTRIAQALGSDSAARGLYDLAVAVGAKVALKDIGMQESDLDKAADLATQNPYYNPKPVTRQGIRELLEQAYHGQPPGHCR
jgi:alcohol dehydrogenase class IV